MEWRIRGTQKEKDELEGELVYIEGTKKKEKVKEYEFPELQEASSDRFKSRNELYDRYN